jgi:hypothetical protein
MRGTASAQAVYRTKSSVREQPMAVLELNANTGIGYQYAGYYYTTFPSTRTSEILNDPTAGGAAIPSTFQTYTDGGVTKVRGAAFTTGVKKINRPIVFGSDMTTVPSLTYVDEPDLAYNERFSIVNCLKANRPNPGIVHMTATEGEWLRPNSRCRLYPASADHNFKYWRAPELNMANPFVYYSREFLTNKIKITVQNHIGIPGDYQVEVLIVNGATQTWTKVWDQANGAFPSDGIFKIYYYNGVWTATPKTDEIHNLNDAVVSNAVKIRGVRLRVTSMKVFSNGYVAGTTVPNTVRNDTYPTAYTTTSAVPFELIEISARLALDVTESVKEFDIESSISEQDSALPVGSLIANDAKLELENFEKIIAFDTVGTPLYGWEPKRSAIDIYFSTGLIGGQLEINRVFVGTITDTDENENNVSLTAMDNSAVLQNTKVLGFVTLNKSLTSIVTMLMDYSGISNFLVHYSDQPGGVIPGATHPENPVVRYYDVNDQTAFEALSDLAEAYQFALAFDSDNVLHMYTKEYLFKRTATPVETFTYEDNGTTLANIKSLEKSPGKPVNDIRIMYDQRFIAKTVEPGSLGLPMWDANLISKEVVAWEADAEYLPAAPLVREITASEGTTAVGYVTLDQEGGDGLRFHGYLLINNEVIAYDAKEYMMKIGGAYTTKFITSQEAYEYWRDRIDQNSRVFFTGRCRIPAGGRGQFGSTVTAHAVETTGLWPYRSNFVSYKFQPSLIGNTFYAPGMVASTWDYKGGAVFNVRGQHASSDYPTRNGAESCIRMTNAVEKEFTSWGATALNPVLSCGRAGHAYLTATPLMTSGSRVIPRRVGAGVRILGRVDGSRKSIAPLGTTGAGGVSMYMSYTPGGGMNGWALEVRPTVSAATSNVILWQITNSSWTQRAAATRIVNVWPPDLNTSADPNDSTWTHVELAFYPSMLGFKPKFVGYINGSAVLSYEPTTTVTTTAWYGPYVRGDSYMDVDYVWWTDKADPNGLSGYGLSDNSDPSEYTIDDVIDGAGGPPMWWANGTETLFAKGSTTGEQQSFGIHEFGPIAHAISVREIEFDDGPYLNPRLATTNSAEFIIPEANLGPYGGTLVIVNARRRAVSVAGDTAPLSIVGYKVESQESIYTLDEHIRVGAENVGIVGSTAEVKVAASRAVHGYIPLEISTSLIQDRETAIKMLDWIADYGSIDCDSIVLEVFGNPLVEPGDPVSIIHPDHGYTSTNRFVVVKVTNKWDTGLKTTLVLRRIV